MKVILVSGIQMAGIEIAGIQIGGIQAGGPGAGGPGALVMTGLAGTAREPAPWVSQIFAVGDPDLGLMIPWVVPVIE